MGNIINCFSPEQNNPKAFFKVTFKLLSLFCKTPLAKIMLRLQGNCGDIFVKQHVSTHKRLTTSLSDNKRSFNVEIQ